MKILRADLSGPVLAILVTVAIIAAGIGVMAYFWWMAPHASKAPTIEIIGAPAYDKNSGTAYVTVRNVGNDPVTIEKLVISGYELTPDKTDVSAGQKVSITFSGGPTGLTGYSVEAVLVTDGGVVPITLYIVEIAPSGVE